MRNTMKINGRPDCGKSSQEKRKRKQKREEKIPKTRKREREGERKILGKTKRNSDSPLATVRIATTTSTNSHNLKEKKIMPRSSASEKNVNEQNKQTEQNIEIFQTIKINIQNNY